MKWKIGRLQDSKFKAKRIQNRPFVSLIKNLKAYSVLIYVFCKIANVFVLLFRTGRTISGLQLVQNT